MKIESTKKGRKYVGIDPENEINLAYPKTKADLQIAICFPNSYELGTSNLGFLSIYRYLNESDNIRCERFYFDHTRIKKDHELRSFETNKNLKEFDCLAFSLSFETDLLNVIRTIQYTGLEVFSEKRDDDSPFIIMGGVVTSINPEPAALFIDSFIIGDGEQVTVKLLNLYMEHSKKQFDPDFQRKASKLPGLYFPSSIDFSHDSYGNITRYKVKKGFKNHISSNVIENIDEYKTYSPVISEKSSFSSCCLIDVIRGCSRKCNFCVSGNLIFSIRFRSLENIKGIIENMRKHTNKYGLIAPSLTDYPDIKGLISLITTYDIEYSLASLRIESVSKDIIELIKVTKQKTITLAPEAGSDRLRKIINKPLKEEKLLTLIKKLLDNDIFNFKLYFMIGLPTEEKEDIEGIIETTKKIKHLMLKRAKDALKIGNLIISTSCFVPKPGTPFESQPMATQIELKEKLKHLRQSLSRIDNVIFTSDIPKWARIQGMISKGDRKVGLLLLKAIEFDGNFPKVFKEVNINPDYYLHRTYNNEYLSPWSHIKSNCSQCNTNLTRTNF